uniref:C2H2-type domain-containing protein n=1 Tax=Scophthalmus maximus TaxID=52904 RepID=A0A8D3C0B4_SCOMX
METEEKEVVSQKRTANIKAEEDVTSGHTCGVCGRSFPLLSSLSQHMRRHTREKPYKCPYCEHRTAQKGSLKAHIRSHKLGLFSHNAIDKEGDLSKEQKDNTEIPDPPEVVSTLDKAHNVNGKVKKKATKKKVKGKDRAEVGDAGSFTCAICGQVFPQVLLLKAHMKRHRSTQDHGCRICGRRFRQAWFLQSHMRIHRVKAQLRGGKSNDLPATINGVPQDPASLINEECLYELCAGCGNFFYDRKTLRTHEKLHKLNHSRTQTQNPSQEDHEASELQITKRHFLESLNLASVGASHKSEEESPGRRIPELDPVCSYQAWQLATKGRLVEATEKCLGWEERLADAEVAYDMDKGEYSFYTAPSARLTDKKPSFCEHCDFHTVDASLLRSHLHKHHQDFRGSQSKQGTVMDNISQTGSKTSRYMDYLRNRSVLLSQPYWNPYTSLAGQASAESNIKTEKSTVIEVKGHGHSADDADSLLNLSSLPLSEGDSTVNYPIKAEGLVRHQCTYCSHTTNYPEVLWIHQRVAHRVDGGSSMAPKWAPRTGPPPFLEGKDCPALSAPRTQRTQSPGSTTPSSKHSASTQPQSKTQSGVPKSKHQSKDSRSSDGTHSSGRVGSLPQKKSGGHSRAAEGGSKGSSAQSTSSSSTVHNKSVSSFQPTSSPKHRGHRAAVEGNFPEEGLGFMLARSHSGTSSSMGADRLHPRRQSCDSSSGVKGPDLCAAMNMWGLHGSKRNFVVDANVVMFFKRVTVSSVSTINKTCQMGYLCLKFFLTAMMTLNGNFGNEVHSSSDASRQVGFPLQHSLTTMCVRLDSKHKFVTKNSPSILQLKT